MTRIGYKRKRVVALQEICGMSPLLGVIDVLGFWNPSVFRVPSTLRAGALRARLGLTVLVALVDDLEDGLCRAFITQNRVSGHLSEGALHEGDFDKKASTRTRRNARSDE